MPYILPRRGGFSLIELSIVLVILGLLTGGILAGRSLIHAAELRSVTTEFTRWTTATKTFRDKYLAMPGDMPNATAFWGTATCPSTNANPRATVATCNGNGDALLTVNPTGGTSLASEYFNFWQHLANAELIEGTYTGVTAGAAASNNTASPGVNAPASKLGGTATWSVQGIGSMDVSSILFIEGVYGNALILGENTGGNGLYNPVMLPEDALNFDTKMDDGAPGTGRIVARENTVQCFLLSDGSAGSASTTLTRTDVIYNPTNKNLRCALVFKNAI